MAGDKIVREPSHAGSWYTSSGPQLNSQLEGWLAAVPTPVQCIGPESAGQRVDELPVPGARMIIAPHAGYSYSGPAAAWAYKAWDVSKAKRVFLLGPSHHHYLTKAALSRCTHYATPLGDLVVDRETTSELHKTGLFEWMSQSVDEDEHSLEMHLPYIYKVLSTAFGNDPASYPLLVPIMIGNTDAARETDLGRILGPYLADPSTAFVISSDFAHWGQRFRYTYYQPSPEAAAQQLSSSSKTPKDPPIHESIKRVDFDCIAACETGSHEEWLDCLEGLLRAHLPDVHNQPDRADDLRELDNGNTVCGRHPIGVMMAAVEEVRKQNSQEGAGAFKFVRYERSSEVKRVSESSVSYASAFAVV